MSTMTIVNYQKLLKNIKFFAQHSKASTYHNCEYKCCDINKEGKNQQ